MSRAAIFLDKDGTLIDDVPYNVDPDRIVLAPHAREGVAALRRAGYALVVVSNQSGVARGHFDDAALEAVRERLEDLLALQFDGFYWCPHHPDGTIARLSIDCECRKPLPGMLQRAARELDLDLGQSWMIGDILNDVEAGRRAGVRTILIDNGNETEWVGGPLRRPHLRVADMGEAALAILCGARDAA